MPILGSTERALEIRKRALERAVRSGRLRLEADGFTYTYSRPETSSSSSSASDEFDGDATEPMSPINSPPQQHGGTADSPIELEDSSDEQITNGDGDSTARGAKSTFNYSAVASVSAKKTAASQSSTSTAKGSKLQTPKARKAKATNSPANITDQKKRRSTRDSRGLDGSDSDSELDLPYSPFHLEKDEIKPRSKKTVGSQGKAKTESSSLSDGFATALGTRKLPTKAADFSRSRSSSATLKFPLKSTRQTNDCQYNSTAGVATATTNERLTSSGPGLSNNSSIVALQSSSVVERQIDYSMKELEKVKMVAEINVLNEQVEMMRFEKKVSMLNQYKQLIRDDSWSHEKIAQAFPELINFFPVGVACTYRNNYGDNKEGREGKRARHE